MALTNAERQARYRAKQTALTRSGGKERARFSGYLSLLSTWRLKNLAAYHGISQGEVLDLALKALEDSLLATIDDPAKEAAYSDGRLRKDGTVVKSKNSNRGGLLSSRRRRLMLVGLTAR